MFTSINPLLPLILYVISTLALLIILYNSIVIVSGIEVASLERPWFGKPMPEGRVVALANEIGIQARIVGQYPLSIIEIMKQVAGGNVKITPEILVQGGNGADSSNTNNVLSAFITSLMIQNKLCKMKALQRKRSN